MAYYRIYGFGLNQRIQSFTEVHCPTDQEALAEAKRFLPRFIQVEVWERGRLVHRLDGHAGATGMASVFDMRTQICSVLTSAFSSSDAAPAMS